MPLLMDAGLEGLVNPGHSHRASVRIHTCQCCCLKCHTSRVGQAPGHALKEAQGYSVWAMLPASLHNPQWSMRVTLEEIQSLTHGGLLLRLGTCPKATADWPKAHAAHLMHDCDSIIWICQ